jgi:hypothetical protein
MAIGDLDGDGKPDVAVTNAISRYISVFRNTATSGTINTSSLAAKVDYPTGAMPYCIALADIDGDGKLDMIASNIGNAGTNLPCLGIYRNISSPGALTRSSFLAYKIFTEGIANYVSVGDLDADDKPDFVVPNGNLNVISVMKNNPVLLGARPADTTIAVNAQPMQPADVINLFPNPNNGTFTLKGTLGGTPQDIESIPVMICDLLGRIVYRNNITAQNGLINETISLSSSSMARGVYLLNLQMKDGNKVIRMIVE